MARGEVARIAGLDGLRALAVIGVVMYHAFPAALVGGFVGVDVFFVISGFLITTLLMRERESTGRIALGRFWVRRVRRLVPVLVLVLVTCTAIAGLIGGDVLVGIGWQLIGGATFGFNWISIAEGTSYFAGTAPELFRNLWSLAVEEQFYLIWPFVVLLLLRLVPKWRAPVLCALGVASAVAMFVMYQPGGEATRVYFGTDTHSFGLLIGAALAVGIQATPRHPFAGGLPMRAAAWIIALALCAGLIWLAATLHEENPLTYRGGMFAVSALAAVLIWVLVRAPWVGRVFDAAPLRFIGVRSYGIYLWHWPVLILLGAIMPPRVGDAWSSALVGIVTVVITLAVSIASYRWVEEPIRRDGFGTWVRGLVSAATSGRMPRRIAVSLVPVLGLVLLGGASAAVASAPAKSSAELAIAQGQQAIDAAQTPASTPPAQAGPGPSRTVAPEATPAPESTAVPSANATPSPTAVPNPALPVPRGDQISAIGDSVMLAAAPALQAAFPGIAIDAAVSRQVSEGADRVRALNAAGQLRPYVLIALGTNGDKADRAFQALVDAAGSARRVVVVNVFGPMAWATTVNERLQRIAAANPNATIADWAGAIASHPGDLAGDGIHPGPAGGRIYAEAVKAALARAGQR